MMPYSSRRGAGVGRRRFGDSADGLSGGELLQSRGSWPELPMSSSVIKLLLSL